MVLILLLDAIILVLMPLEDFIHHLIMVLIGQRDNLLEILIWVGGQLILMLMAVI
jgi:hypothetical protein